MENLKQFLIDKPEIKKEYDRIIDLAKDYKDEFNKKKEEYLEEHSDKYDIDTSEEPFRSILRELSQELKEIGIKISSYDETRAVIEEKGYEILELIQKDESRATAWSSGNVGKKWRNTIVPLELFPGPSGSTLPNYMPSKKIRTYEILEERGSRVLISHKRFWPPELWVNFGDGELIEDEEKIKQLEELNELSDKANRYIIGSDSNEDNNTGGKIMKTKEFIEKIEALDLKVENIEDTLLIGDTNRYYCCLSKVEQYKLEIFHHHFETLEEDVKHKLLDMIIEYIKTPVEEREEPKRYYLTLPHPYQIETRYLNKRNGNYMFANNIERNRWQTKFTQEEIDNLPNQDFIKTLNKWEAE